MRRLYDGGTGKAGGGVMSGDKITKGDAFLLKIGVGGTPVNYATCAGLRLQDFNLFADGAMTLVARGIFTGSAAEARIQGHAQSGTIDEYELVFERGARLRGRFLVTRLDNNGHFNGERQYEIALSSVGAVVLP